MAIGRLAVEDHYDRTTQPVQNFHSHSTAVLLLVSDVMVLVVRVQLSLVLSAGLRSNLCYQDLDKTWP